jgi:DHA1 family bicyclomycin/chloramphenicol resistance-like MFS transporter
MTLPSETDRAEGRASLAFLVFLALMTSVIALTIDAVLPALDAISADLAFAEANDRHLVVLLVFAGMGLSQLVFGTLADSIGRKRAALAGWAIYVAGTVVALAAVSPAMMFAGRFLQGLGAGGPRIVAMAIVRDLYEGRAMARILSMVLTIFMAVPMFAPLIGQGIAALGGWRAIFALYLALALVSGGWYLFAMPETLRPEHRRPPGLAALLGAIREVVTNRVAMCYTASAVCVFAPFVVYLATAQQVLEELYGLGAWFPLAFGALALAFACATFLNSRLVMRVGMRRLSILGLCTMTGVSALALGLMTLTPMAGVPPFWLFMGLMAVIFFCVAILFSNFNALALQPLGHVAGTASAVVMSMATLGAAPAGFLIARGFDGSLTPMFTGYFLLGLVGVAAMGLAEGGRR